MCPVGTECGQPNRVGPRMRSDELQWRRVRFVTFRMWLWLAVLRLVRSSGIAAVPFCWAGA